MIREQPETICLPGKPQKSSSYFTQEIALRRDMGGGVGRENLGAGANCATCANFAALCTK